MTETEKGYKLDEYFAKVKTLLGHRLWAYDCNFYGDKAVMLIEYCDYKPSDQLRKELNKLMPEVELAMVKRTISDSARMSEVMEYAGTGEDDRGNTILVKTPAGDYLTLDEWAVARLYDKDLTTRDINYDKMELRDLSREELYLKLRE